MKLVYKKDETSPLSSFYVKRIKEPVLDINWHFHEEYQIVYIIKGQGVRLVGDNIAGFRAGELVLIGPNVPHLWRTSTGISLVDRIIVKFDEQPCGVDLFSLPEFSKIRSMLFKSTTCVLFDYETRHKVHSEFLALTAATDGGYRLCCLMKILTILSECNNMKPLSNPYSTTKIPTSSYFKETDRLKKVISFISDNYEKNPTLKDLASVVAMTPQSFCRFFKEHTGKTYIQFLNEFRIGKACVLLINNNLSITDICYQLGFKSTTNFNRIFKKVYHITPMEYRNRYSRVDDHLRSLEFKYPIP